MGNIRKAISTFAAPVVVAKFGWSLTIQFYLILLLLFAVLNFFLGDRTEKKERNPIMQQIKSVYKNGKLWFFSLFFFVIFGFFVVFFVFLLCWFFYFCSFVNVVAWLR